MHCLEVIIKRNAEAAGREAAHARNDGNWKKSHDIDMVSLAEDKSGEQEAYGRGYRRGRQ